MNRKFVFGALVLATAGSSAFADDITIDPHVFVSTRTRGEVQAEQAKFQRSGVNPWSISYNPLRFFRSASTRGEVEQEYLASRDEVRALGGEDSGSEWLAQRRSPQAVPQLASLQTRQP